MSNENNEVESKEAVVTPALHEDICDLVDAMRKRLEYVERGVWLACTLSLTTVAPRGKKPDLDRLDRYLKGEDSSFASMYTEKEES